MRNAIGNAMDTKAVDTIARIKRSYALLREAHDLLERSGHSDIAASLYMPLGLMEDRFDLASASDISSEIERNNPLSSSN